jgi:hypothetical protein
MLDDSVELKKSQHLKLIVNTNETEFNRINMVNSIKKSYL